MEKRILSAEMLKAYERYLFLDEKSEHTIEKYRRDVRAFMLFAGKTSVSKEVMVRYKEEIGEKYEKTSANSMIAALNSFFRFAGWEDCCVKQFKIQKMIFCNRNKELTKEEYFRLCRTAEKMQNERLSMILQTLGGTGIRISELPYITVEALRKGKTVVNCKNKIRVIFIVKQLQLRLMRYCRKTGHTTGPVFVTQSGKPMDRSDIWREMKKICKKAGVDPAKVFPHNLRHLFAQVFYEIKKDIAKLADILGHSSINTTRIYITSSGNEHRKYLENMRMIL